MDGRKKVAFVRDVRVRIDNLQHWTWGGGASEACTISIKRLLYFANTGIRINAVSYSSTPFHTLRLRRFLAQVTKLAPGYIFSLFNAAPHGTAFL